MPAFVSPAKHDITIGIPWTDLPETEVCEGVRGVGDLLYKDGVEGGGFLLLAATQPALAVHADVEAGLDAPQSHRARLRSGRDLEVGETGETGDLSLPLPLSDPSHRAVLANSEPPAVEVLQHLDGVGGGVGCSVEELDGVLGPGVERLLTVLHLPGLLDGHVPAVVGPVAGEVGNVGPQHSLYKHRAPITPVLSTNQRPLARHGEVEGGLDSSDLHLPGIHRLQDDHAVGIKRIADSSGKNQPDKVESLITWQTYRTNPPGNIARL